MPINIILACIDQTTLTAVCLFTEYKHCKRISQQAPLVIHLIRTNPRCRVSPPMHVSCYALLTPQPNIITCPVLKQNLYMSQFMMIMIITMMISNHHDDQARTICRWKCLQCFTILHVTVDNMIITMMISTMKHFRRGESVGGSVSGAGSRLLGRIPVQGF